MFAIVTIILLHLSHRVIFDKNLLYTLLSRGKIYKNEKAVCVCIYIENNLMYIIDSRKREASANCLIRMIRSCKM